MTINQTSATLLIIKYLLIQNNYNKYINSINRENLSNTEKVLFKYLDELFEQFARDLSVEEYSLFVLNRCDNREVFSVILSALEKVVVSDELVTSVLEESRLRNEAYKIAQLAIDVSEGKEGFTRLKEHIQAVESSAPVVEEVSFVTDDLEVLYNEQYKKTGLRWRLGTLNRIFGSLRKGDFGFVFARPETGKTTFLASEATYFAEQVPDESPILWFNNEEEGKKVKIRCYQASLGVSLTELFSDVTRNKQTYSERIGNRIRLFDSANIDRSTVEGLCNKLKPSLVIFDQIDKLHGFDGDREDLRLGAVYRWSRELAKVHCPVIGVCQADGTAEGKKWLTMDNVSNAKTAKQAEADWILGIGKVHDDGYEFVRYLHASKNKLQGDEDSDPRIRHGKQEVIIQPDIARYSDYQR